MYDQKEPISLRHASPFSTEPLRTAPIQLSHDLWFDQERYLLLRSDAALPLTAREALLLARLLESPQRFYSTAHLARLLARVGDVVLPDEHGVEQIVSKLRRKLGEPQRHPRLLLNRRGIGYGLFLQEIAG